MSNDDGDMKKTSFEVDKETYELAMSKLDHGGMTERLRETVHTIAHGAETTERERVKNNLEELRDEREDIDADIQTLKSNRRTVERKISRAEDRLNELQNQSGEYDGTLAMLETQLHDGVRILEGNDNVATAAEVGECSKQDVIEDLKQRNPDVPNRAFRLPEGDEGPNWKTDVVSID